jgi:hypothetical protein
MRRAYRADLQDFLTYLGQEVIVPDDPPSYGARQP